MRDNSLKSLDYLFKPRTLAIFEANEKLWYFLKGLKEQSFDESKLYLINPSKEHLFDLKCYKSLEDVPEDTIDLLILAVGRERLIPSLKKILNQKPIRTIHIFTAGMGESDNEGTEIEKELYTILKNNKNSTRAIGPNCMGVYCPKGHLAYEPLLPKEQGNISLVFQSGDLHSQMIRVGSSRHGLSYSKGVSVGNCVDLQISDFLEYYSSDDDTDLILVYFEGLNIHHPNEGKRLLNTLKAMKKPVLFMQGGKTTRAQKAAISHTGSISTSQKIWKGIYEQAPIVEVPTSLDDMIDYTYLFHEIIKKCKNNKKNVNYPKGKNVLLILWSGGFGIIDTNILTEIGLNVPHFEGEILEKLRKIYPIKIGSLSNPLDIPWISTSQTYVELGKTAISANIDLVMIETFIWEGEEEQDFFKPYYHNLSKIKDYTESLNKIFILILTDYPSRTRERVYRMLINDGFIIYPSVRRAAKSYLAFYEYGQKLKNLYS
jgi:acyl-CoA synthetase (NDP forming)